MSWRCGRRENEIGLEVEVRRRWHVWDTCLEGNLPFILAVAGFNACWTVHSWRCIPDMAISTARRGQPATFCALTICTLNVFYGNISSKQELLSWDAMKGFDSFHNKKQCHDEQCVILFCSDWIKKAADKIKIYHGSKIVVAFVLVMNTVATLLCQSYPLFFYTTTDILKRYGTIHHTISVECQGVNPTACGAHYICRLWLQANNTVSVVAWLYIRKSPTVHLVCQNHLTGLELLLYCVSLQSENPMINFVLWTKNRKNPKKHLSLCVYMSL